MTSPDGRLLMWDPAVGGPAVVQPPPGRGPVPNGRCFVVTQERFIIIFGSINDGTVGGGLAALRLVRSGKPWRVGLFQRHRRRAFSTSSRRAPIICARSRPAVGRDLLDRQESLRQPVSRLPTSTITSSSPTTARPGRRSRWSTRRRWRYGCPKQGMFAFDGTSIMPVAVQGAAVDRRRHRPFRARSVFAVHVDEFNEFWWFFPQLDSPTTPGRILQLQGGLVVAGATVAFGRDHGVLYRAHHLGRRPVAFQHEVGSAYANRQLAVALPWAETFDLNLTRARA